MSPIVYEFLQKSNVGLATLRLKMLILIHPPFPGTNKGVHICICVHPCVLQYIIYYVLCNPGAGHTGMGQVLTFVRVLRWNTVQVK